MAITSYFVDSNWIRRISYTLNKSATLGGLSPILRKGILAYSNLGCKDSVEFYLLNTSSCKETIPSVKSITIRRYCLIIKNSLFFDYTTELSKIKEVTIYLIFKIYNTLFNHFFKVEALLKPSRLKLDKYYSQTDNLKGYIYIRENQSHFPTIALLTRDILSILVTSTSVERLFNTTRDICHYRRGRLKSETIEELILFLYITRFNIKDTKAKQLEQFFTLAEIESAKDDNEKEEGVDNRLREISPHLIDIDIEVTEPELLETVTQRQALGRKRKSRVDKDFEQY
ncbi:hypothetical protein N7501_011577 [Penicillium viridicatum]|nr:hypothetical protein N7501_011577 [Penicillium viridicatum]